ncbi:ribonuclease HI [Methylorubrum extorquens]|nr:MULTISPECIES: ribonuclease HI [Methylorubrum]ARO57434.1 ribonuclease HI [Methylorubrum zatmanii]KQP89581.1 ribonuclease H [Methylobacterium sp. Leaf119]KQQ12383.1 ribonuclease H [Methylobacterium sp. Leaf121]WIU40678.1 ribonuclease HI [Methylorubrum extorquens]
MRTIVYADGGCDPNPGPGGWAAVIQAPTGTIELYGGELATTNNRMELTAAIRALEHFPEGAAIEMRCDSQYVVKSVTEWMRGWKARGWRTATGPVKNIDLMQRLDALAAARDVRWTWVRGHAGEAGNERADRLATLGRREALSGKTSGEAMPLPADAAPALAPAQPVQSKTVQVALSADLANALSRAAGRAGITPQAYLEDAVRLALELKPPGVARVRAELQKAS